VIGLVRNAHSKELFSLYTSAKAESSSKIQRPFFKTIVIILLFSAVLFSWGSWRLYHAFRLVVPAHSQTSVATATVSRSKNRPASSLPVPISSSPVPAAPGVNYHDPLAFDRVKLSHFIDIDRNGKQSYKLLYHGVFTLSDFPYHYEMSGGYFYAFIPHVESFPDSDKTGSSKEDRQGTTARGPSLAPPQDQTINAKNVTPRT
jgi:hypothetical protein